MAHNSYPAGTPTGVVPALYVVPSTDWATVILQCFQSINGDAGGTWAPGAFITVGGFGFQLTGTGHSLAASARLNVESTAEIRLKNGALLKADGTIGDVRLEVLSNVATLTVQLGAVASIAGTLTLTGTSVTTVANGAEVDFASGSTAIFQSGATLETDAGSFCNVSGSWKLKTGGIGHIESGAQFYTDAGSTGQLSGAYDVANSLTWIGGSWPKLDTRTWERAAKRATPLTYDGGLTTGPASPDIWEEQSDAFPLVPCWRTLAVAVTGGASLIVFDGLPQGGTITTVTVTCRGTISIDANTLPTYRIVRWKDSGAAGYTFVSALKTDDGHTVDNFFFVTATTTVTANASQVVDNQYRYGLLVTHPYRTGSSQGMRVYDVQINGTATALQL